MSSTHLDIISEAETKQFLSEKVLVGGGVTVVTSTSSNAFAAKNLVVYGLKGILR